MPMVIDASYCALLVQVHHTGPAGADGIFRFPRWGLVAEPVLKVPILIVAGVLLEDVHDHHGPNHLWGVRLSTPGP